MFPSPATALQMHSLTDLRAYYTMDDTVWQAFVDCVWRSRGRYPTPRGAASCSFDRLSGKGGFARWGAADGNPGSPCGPRLQPGEENSPRPRWWSMGEVDRREPIWRSRSSATRGPSSTSSKHCNGTQAEELTGAGPRGRWRVHGRRRGHESQVAGDTSTFDWGPPSTRRRTKPGTTERFGTKDFSTGRSPLHRFWGLCAFRAEGTSSEPLQDLRADTRGLHSEGTPRTSVLRAVEGLLSGSQDGSHNAGLCLPGQPPLLRNAHGEDHEVVPDGMAPGVLSGRPGQGLSCQQDESQNSTGHQDREDTSRWMGRREAMGHGVQTHPHGRAVLARTSTRPGFGLGGIRFKRPSQNTGRAACAGFNAGRPTSHSPFHGGQYVHFTSKFSKGTKGSKEETLTSGKRQNSRRTGRKKTLRKEKASRRGNRSRNATGGTTGQAPVGLCHLGSSVLRL